MTGRFAMRITGSSDLYQGDHGKTPINSINFVTCHDGFTLNDLVSYSVKHNETNGENNRDGLDQNYSENNGVEGPTSEPAIEAVRSRQLKNMLTTLFVSRGVPMLLGGDEFRRTQKGNNNAYCQDNDVSWYDWSLVERNADLRRFVRKLIEFRRAHPVLSGEQFYGQSEIVWFGAEGRDVQWDGYENVLGCMVPETACKALCLLFNASFESRTFTLPRAPTGSWRIAIDTSRASPDDAAESSVIRPLDGTFIAVGARSTAALISG